MAFLTSNNWNLRILDVKFNSLVGNMDDTGMGLKWWLYIASFLPFWWRFWQNMKKWLVYGHRLQMYNSIKYFTAILGPVSLIIYLETHKKGFLINYYVWKSISTIWKIFWDLYYDWGLFRGTKPNNRLLRDEMKFHPVFYYFAMVLDVVGQFSWVFVVFAYEILAEETVEMPIDSLAFFNRVSWILWGELILVSFRRTIWVLIRVENEFFSNFE